VGYSRGDVGEFVLFETLSMRLIFNDLFFYMQIEKWLT